MYEYMHELYINITRKLRKRNNYMKSFSKKSYAKFTEHKTSLKPRKALYKRPTAVSGSQTRRLLTYPPALHGEPLSPSANGTPISTNSHRICNEVGGAAG